MISPQWLFTSGLVSVFITCCLPVVNTVRTTTVEMTDSLILTAEDLHKIVQNLNFVGLPLRLKDLITASPTGFLYFEKKIY